MHFMTQHQEVRHERVKLATLIFSSLVSNLPSSAPTYDKLSRAYVMLEDSTHVVHMIWASLLGAIGALLPLCTISRCQSESK